MSNVMALDPDENCHVCAIRYGDHSLDDLIEHMMTPTHDLPLEEIPGGPVPSDGTVDPDAPIVDGVTVRPGRDEDWPPWLACVIIDFTKYCPNHGPEPVESVVFAGPPTVLRQAGQLLVDSFSMAADIAVDPTDN